MLVMGAFWSVDFSMLASVIRVIAYLLIPVAEVDVCWSCGIRHVGIMLVGRGRGL
jgi:hypothetical protein